MKNQKLKNYIEEHDIIVYFYPHINMQKYAGKFEIVSDNIKIVNNNDIDIQDLLKTSALMITDFSSVYMDFAYMRKPIIFYQFDKDEYREKQYQSGYFDYENDGFGDVYYQESKVVNKLIEYVNINYKIESKYLNKMNEFFEINDSKNSERIYNAIKEMGGKR